MQPTSGSRRRWRWSEFPGRAAGSVGSRRCVGAGAAANPGTLGSRRCASRRQLRSSTATTRQQVAESLFWNTRAGDRAAIWATAGRSAKIGGIPPRPARPRPPLLPPSRPRARRHSEVAVDDHNGGGRESPPTPITRCSPFPNARSAPAQEPPGRSERDVGDGPRRRPIPCVPRSGESAVADRPSRCTSTPRCSHHRDTQCRADSRRRRSSRNAGSTTAPPFMITQIIGDISEKPAVLVPGAGSGMNRVLTSRRSMKRPVPTKTMPVATVLCAPADAQQGQGVRIIVRIRR